MRETKLQVISADGTVVGYEAVIDGQWHFKTPDGRWIKGVWQIPGVIRRQYAGLKDKSGVEIYDGDIIEFTSNGSGNGTCKVEWNNELSGFAPFCEQITYAADSYSEWWLTSYKVIGNIYENPELVKEAA